MSGSVYFLVSVANIKKERKKKCSKTEREIISERGSFENRKLKKNVAY